MIESQTCKRFTFQKTVIMSNNSCLNFIYDQSVLDASVLQSPMEEVLSSMDFKYYLQKCIIGGILIIAFCLAFYKWFIKYRLRYLLRLISTIYITFLLLNIFCCCQLQLQSAVWLFGSLTVFMSYVRFHWSLPLDIRKKLHQRRSSRQEFSNEIPPVFPNGWIPIIESIKISVGCSKTVSAIGKKFCVFRGFEGKIYVLDAYCSHLGAELSAGGRVIEECIECPFHEWQFDGKTGQCLNIPNAQKVPDVAKIKTWCSCEKNGFIFVWYHAENELPSWEMPSLINIESGDWKFGGRTEHEVHCHIQEIPENGADVAHLHVIHSKSVFLRQYTLWQLGDILLGRIEHEWQPISWVPDQEKPHIRIKLNQRMSICGIRVPYFSLDMDIEQIGPATVHLHMVTCFGRAVLLQHIIPEGPLNHRIIHLLYTESRFSQFAADLFILSEAIMLERDIDIWNNKRYLKNPILVKEDKLIKNFRRWYSQFYSRHSPTLKDIRDQTLDW